MEKRSVWLLLYLTCSLPACCWAFTCFEGTNCRGDSIPGVARKGDCCAEEGLSFTDEREQCFDCFSEAAFAGEGSEFFLAFFDNLFPGRFFSRANVRLSVGAVGVGLGQERVQFMVESREDQETGRTGVGGTPTEVELDIDLRLNDVSDREEGICVRSLDGQGLSIVALSEEFTSVETFKVLPCVFLPNQGYEYFVVSVQPTPVDPEIGAPIEERSAFAIVPSEDQTLINLNLTRRVVISGAPDLARQIGSGVIEVGQPVVFTLNRRQSLYISSIDDLSGSRVVTNKPVSFITGHECGNIPRNFTFCDQMVEQIPPTATWGYEFLTAPISSRIGRDVFKAVSSLGSGSFTGTCFLPSGVFERNIDLTFQRAGQAVEFQVSSSEYCYFESTVPTLLLQFSAGTGVDNVTSADPFMVMVPPIQQYQNSFLLSTFRSQAVQGDDYVNIFVPSEVDRNGVFLDGNQVTELLGEGGWVEIRCPDRESTCGYAAQLNVSAESHVLNHTNPSARFSVIAYWLAFRAGHGYVGGLTQRPIALPQVTFETAAVNVFENESSIGIDLMRSGRDFGQSVEVFIKSGDGTAIAGEDYIALNTSIVFRPGELLTTVRVQLAPDDVFPEDSKSFDIFLTASPGVYLSPTTIVNVTVLNDDPDLPVVNISFAETRLTVREGVGIVQFRLLKADDTSVPGGRGVVRVRLDTEDGSAFGAPFGQGDYQRLSDEVVAFDVSDTELTVTTTITDNDVLENMETFTATIVALEGPFPVAVVVNGTVTVEIVDNDFVVVGFTQPLFTVSEEQRTVDVGVDLLFGATAITFSVIVSTVNDFDAVAGEDFEAVTTELFFGDDFQSEPIVRITILDDNQIESSETIALRLRIAGEFSSGSIQLIPDVAQVLIEDNDRVLIGLDGPSEVEEGGSVEVTVRVLEGRLEQGVGLLVGLSAVSGTARAGVDFEGMINRRLDFTGDTSSQTVRIGTIEDETFEEQETFFVLISLLSCPGAGEVDNQRANITVTIVDDDPQITGFQCFPAPGCSGNPLPTRTLEDCCTTFGFSFQLEGGVNICQPCIVVGFSQPIYNLRERESPHVLAVNLVKGDSLPQSLSLAVRAMPLTASLSDFQVVTPEIALLTESPQAEVRVTLPQESLDDNDDTGVETFILLLNDELGLAPANVFFRQSVVNIEDTVVRIGFAQDSYTVQEGAVRGVSLFIASNGVSDVPIELLVTLQPGTAILNDDYTGGQTTLTFLPGLTQLSLSVSIVNDDILEVTEQFTAQLSLVDSGAIITQSSTTVVINDDDPVVLEFDSPTYTVAEGESISVIVVRRGSSQVPTGFSVTVSTQDGSATEGEDYSPLRITQGFPVSTGDVSVPVAIQTRADSLVEGEERFFVILSDPPEGARLGRSNATVIIEDFVPSVGFEEASFTVEEGVTLEVCAIVTTPLGIGRNIFVQVVSLDGTATGSEDYTFISTSLTFSAELSRSCVNVPIQVDSVLELAETFELILTADGGVTLEPDRTTVTIIDQSFVTIGFEQTTYTVEEGQVIGVFAAVTNGMLDRDIIVSVSSVDDEAVAPGDYVLITNELTFSASVPRNFIPVITQDDPFNVLENDEDFTLTLTTLDGSVNLTPDEATVTIIDNDLIFVRPEQPSYTVVEGVDSTVEVCAIVSEGQRLERAVVVTLATSDDSATSTEPTDYVATVVDVTFDPDISRQCVNIAIVNDDILEDEEQFIFTLTTTDRDILFNFRSSSIRISEDPNDRVRIGFELPFDSVMEDSSQVTVSVRLQDDILEANVAVLLHTMGDTAIAGVDYVDIPQSEPIRLAFGPLTFQRSVNISIINDSLFEPTEYFLAVLRPVNSTVIVDPQRANISILNVGDELVIGFEQTVYDTTESGDEPRDNGVELCAVISRGSLSGRAPVIVSFSTSDGTATSTGDPPDYDTTTIDIIFEVDDYYYYYDDYYDCADPEFQYTTFCSEIRRRCITVNILDDTITEGPEVFFMLATSSAERVVVRPDRANVTIIDNDPAVIGFVETAVTVGEAAGPAILNVALLAGTLGIDFFVDFITLDGTALAPDDYTTTTRRLTFGPSSVLNVPVPVPVDIIDDNLLEFDETFTASLTIVPPPLLVVASPNLATVTIIDDDPVEIGFVPDLYTVSEDGGSVTLTVRVISGSLARNVEVMFSTQNGQALAGEDYEATNQSLIFSSTVIEQTVTVPIINDTFFEFQERFFGVLTQDPADVNVMLSPDEAKVLIDDDDALRIGFNPVMYPVREDEGPVTLTVEVLEGRPGPGTTVTVSYRLLDDTAFAGSDYTRIMGQLMFTNTDLSRDFTVMIINDGAAELDEVFLAQLFGGPVVPTFSLDPQDATVTIEDDDDVIIGFTQDAYIVIEDAGFINVTVAVLLGSLASGREVIVTLQTSDGTAVSDPAGEPDFMARSIMLTFSSSVTSITVPIRIINDLLLEMTREQFTSMLTLVTSESGITLQPASVPIDIIDNDDVFIGFEQPIYEVGEGDGSVNVRILVIMGMLRRDVIVSVATQDDTAVAGSDYTNRGTLEFTFSQFVTEFDIPYEILNDDIHENTEYFNSILSTSDDNAFLQPSSTRIRILDNDPLLFTFERPMYMFFENSVFGTVCVNKTGDTTETVQIMIQGDLQPGVGVIDQLLTFTPADTQICVDFTIQDDDIALELPEILTFTITVIDPVPGIEINPFNRTIVTIVDLDELTISLVKPQTIPEASGTVLACATFDRPFAQPFELTAQSGFNVSGRPSATPDVDYGAVSTTLQAVPGDTQVCFDIAITNDTFVEELLECFALEISLGSNPPDGSIIFDSSANAECCIEDDDRVLIGFDPDFYSLEEDDGPVVLSIVVLDGQLQRAAAVNFSTADGIGLTPAFAPGDYTSIFDAILQFDGITTTREVTVTIENDDLVEFLESFQGLLTTSDPAVDLAPATALIEIIDQDRVIIGFQPVSYTVAEEAIFVIVSASVLGGGTLARAVAVDFATVPGTATPLDFTETTTTLTFSPVSLTRSVTIPITDDNIVEAVETFFATLTSEPDQPVDLDPALADISILDIVDSVTIGFEQTTYTVGEGQVVEVCAVVVSGTLDRDAIVQLSSVDDEAVAPGDYTSIVEDLTFSADVDRVCRNVISVDDNILEIDEDFDLTLTTTDGSVNLAPDEAIVTIIDNDTVLIGFEQTLYPTTEGVNTVVELCAIVVGSTMFERTAIVSFATRDGSATSIAPVDYVDTSVDFTFGPEVSRSCVNVSIADDDILEDAENFFATLTTTDPDVLLAPDEAQVVINEDPTDRVTIGFDPDIYSVVENDSQVTVTVRLRQGTLETSVSVNLHTTGATATADVDYDNILPSEAIELVFDPSNFMMPQNVDISIIDDQLLERVEFFFGELTTRFPTVILDPQQANISIIDDDEATIGFLETRYTVIEGDDDMANLLVGVIAGTLTKDIIVRFYTEDGSATQPMDYLEVDMLLTFSPTVTTISVPVTIIDDLVDEPQEEFEAELQLITVTNVTIAPQLATVIIGDNDRVTIGLERVTYNVTEGDGTVEVCAVLRSGTLARNAVVTLSTSDGSAMEPLDYGRISVELTFNATVSRACADVLIVDDEEFEIEESFDVTLTTTDGDIILDPDSGIVFITDEDELEIGYEFPEYTVDESAGSVEVCVVVTMGIVGTTKVVTFDLEEGSATEPEDYSFPSTVEYTFAPRVTRDCVDIPIVNDALVDQEYLERFFGNLISVVPASPRITLSPDRTRITIVDNDDQLRIGFLEVDYSVLETDLMVNVTVGIIEGNPEPGLMVTVALSESDDSAFDGEDYRSIGIVDLVFGADTTVIGTIIPIIDDIIDEVTERFFARLNLVTNRPNIIVSPASANILIQDDDGVVIGLERTRYSVIEAETLVEVCAILMRGQLQIERIVTLATSDITAEAPADYETVSVDLTFSATVSRSCVNVTIHDDILVEGPEEIRVTLTTTDAEVGLNQTEAIITIVDLAVVRVMFVLPAYTFGEAIGVGFIEVEKTGIVQDEFSVIVQGGPSTQPDVAISGVGVDTIITFGAGAGAPDVIRVNVTINDDQVGLEAVEMFPVSLSLSQPSEAVEVGVPDVTIVNIIDDDEVAIRFGTTALSVNEDAGTFMMCVLKNRDTILPVTVDIQLIQGSATQDVDYDSTTLPTSVTIQPLSDRFCFNSGIIDDDIVLEGDEDFQLMLVNPSPGAVVITDDTTTITILDDDVAEVSFERPSYTVNENDGVARICLLKDLESAVPFSVDTDTVDDTATSPADYIGGPRSVTFQTVAGDRQCIDITVIPDSEREPIECFDVNLQIPAVLGSSVVPGTPSTARVCIEDVGVLVNDTVIGDPLFIVPILVSDEDQLAIGGNRISLCYEIHGEPSQWFNLVTDECTSVNAYYTNFTDFLNVIERVAIRATDDAGNCREIEVDLDGCSTTVDGVALNISRYEADGIRIRQYPRRVRVAVPNCAELSLIMWITCETRTLQDPFNQGVEIVGDMIRFDVLRGLNFGHSDSHGLIGQFWNVLVDLSPFNGTLRPGVSGENRYEIDFNREGSPERMFTGYLYQLTWDQRDGPCLYVGNRQGGPLYEVLSPNDPVIEGTYADYRVAGAFDETGFTFARFDGTFC